MSRFTNIIEHGLFKVMFKKVQSETVLQCKVVNTIGSQKKVVCYHLSSEDNIKDEQLFEIEPKIPAGAATK